MSTALIQHKITVTGDFSTTGATTGSGTLPAPCTAGNNLLVFVYMLDVVLHALPNPPTFVSALGNTFTRVAGIYSGTSWAAQIYTCNGCLAGSETITLGGGNARSSWAIEIMECAAADILDGWDVSPFTSGGTTSSVFSVSASFGVYAETTTYSGSLYAVAIAGALHSSRHMLVLQVASVGAPTMAPDAITVIETDTSSNRGFYLLETGVLAAAGGLQINPGLDARMNRPVLKGGMNG